ncbi:hypothetical protein FACS1894110_23810 [Spirochaetia bacterium]|nr:hypothetical protein FACS1894110_23810 [Spirochaetia bacterium]
MITYYLFATKDSPGVRHTWKDGKFYVGGVYQSDMTLADFDTFRHRTDPSIPVEDVFMKPLEPTILFKELVFLKLKLVFQLKVFIFISVAKCLPFFVNF